MLTQTPKGGYYLGKGGGVANAIVGSLFLAIGAAFLSSLVGLPIAFALQKEYLGRRFAWITRLSLDILWGTPSIGYGAFGFIVMVLDSTPLSWADDRLIAPHAPDHDPVHGRSHQDEPV
jgi:phosphate transport system permease protein